MTKRPKPLTPKQRVLREYPRARLWSEYFGVNTCPISHRIKEDFNTIGAGSTPRKAWADAARKL
jgi:hypothetical protein